MNHSIDDLGDPLRDVVGPTKVQDSMSKKSKRTPVEEFVYRVQKKLGKKPKNSVEIARQLRLVDAKGNVTSYGSAKVRKALQKLAAEGLAVHSGAFRTSAYRLP